ncbi:hypothetical protein BGW38_008922, partial [Lunasporangiospora selenospora]
MSNLFTRAMIKDEQLKVRLFLASLTSDRQPEVRRKNPKMLEDAITIATREENIRHLSQESTTKVETQKPEGTMDEMHRDLSQLTKAFNDIKL